MNTTASDLLLIPNHSSELALNGQVSYCRADPARGSITLQHNESLTRLHRYRNTITGLVEREVARVDATSGGELHEAELAVGPQSVCCKRIGRLESLVARVVVFNLER